MNYYKFKIKIENNIQLADYPILMDTKFGLNDCIVRTEFDLPNIEKSTEEEWNNIS